MTDKEIIIENKRSNKNIYKIKDDITELSIFSKKYGEIIFIIDTKLIKQVCSHYWSIANYRGKIYAQSFIGYDLNNKKINILLHRLITKCPKHLMVDHINHNTLDNRLENLKICTNKENQHNRRNFEGVRQTKWGYQVQMRVNNKSKCFGTYKTLDEAKQVRISAEKEYRPYVKEINKYGT